MLVPSLYLAITGSAVHTPGPPQGDFLHQLPELLLKMYGTSNGVGKDHISYMDVESKKKKK
jgi:hypothetical protein